MSKCVAAEIRLSVGKDTGVAADQSAGVEALQTGGCLPHL